MSYISRINLNEGIGNVPRLTFDFLCVNVDLIKMDLEDRLAEDIFIRTNEGFEKLISRDEISKKKTVDEIVLNQ